MANTLSTYSLRDKYLKASLETALRNADIAASVFKMDMTEQKRIQNPYITQQTAAIQAVAGTYSVSAMTTTDDTLTVSEEVVFGTHVFDFEERTANFNLAADFLDDLAYSVMNKAQQYALNKVLDDATTTYTTPAGGFTQSANVPVIVSNLLSKVAGYAQGTPNNHFLVLENTDVVGIAQAAFSSGFNYADSALMNGPTYKYGGVDIYIVRTGTFVTDTLGTLSAVNSGHRLFGVKNVATYAMPRGIRYEEKGVSGKTGKEVVAYAICGAKAWAPRAALFVDITLA